MDNGLLTSHHIIRRSHQWTGGPNPGPEDERCWRCQAQISENADGFSTIFFWFRCLGWNSTSGESSASQVWLASFQSDVIPIDLRYGALRTAVAKRNQLRARVTAGAVDVQQFETMTLQGTNISHLGKRKIIFKKCLGMGYVNFQQGKQLFGTFNARTVTFCLFI